MAEQGPEEPRVVSSILTRGTREIPMKALPILTNYLLANAPTNTPMVRRGMIGAAAILLLSLLAPMIIARNKAWRKKINADFLPKWTFFGQVMGLVMVIILFLRSQGLPYFTIRLWEYSVGLVALVWAGILLNHYRRTIPEFQHESIRVDKYEKYLPKAKRSGK